MTEEQIAAVRKKLAAQAATRIPNGLAAMKLLDEACVDAMQTNEQLLLQTLADNADTEYGRRYNFADIHSIEDFKKNVPLSTYDDYEPYIRRMTDNGETDLITAYPVVHYATTSGSIGIPKRIPVSERTMEIYNKFTGTSSHLALHRYIEAHPELGLEPPKPGRVFNTMEITETTLPCGIQCGPISGKILSKVVPFLGFLYSVPKQLIFPPVGKRIDKKYLKALFALHDTSINQFCSAFMTALVDQMDFIRLNWERLVEDVEAGTINKDIEMPDDLRAELEPMLSPNPERAAQLRAEFEKGFDEPIIPRIWPNVSMIVAVGTGGFARYTEKMRRYSGDIPMYFTYYSSSEAFMGISIAMNQPDYVLMPQSCFYEFLPADADEDETETLTLDQLEVGKHYEIILTTLSGFYRYRLKDVIQVTGHYGTSPTVVFAYRKNQMVSIAGEKTNDAAVRWAIDQFGAETDCDVLEYSVYADTDCEPGRYVILMEPNRRLDKANMEEYRRIIEEKLGIANPSLGAKVQSGVLSPTQLHFVQPETYLLYREMMSYKGMSTDQLKPVRVLNSPAKKRFFFALIDDE